MRLEREGLLRTEAVRLRSSIHGGKPRIHLSIRIEHRCLLCKIAPLRDPTLQRFSTQHSQSVCASGGNCRIRFKKQTSGAFEMPSDKKFFLLCVQPPTNLFFAEAPLPPDFQRRNFPAFRPKAYSPRRYAQPSRNICSRKKYVVLLTFWIMHCRTTPKLMGVKADAETTFEKRVSKPKWVVKAAR